MNWLSEDWIMFVTFALRILGAIVLFGILFVATEQVKYWKTGLLICMIAVGVSAFGIYLKDINTYTPIIASSGLDIMLICVFVMYVTRKTKGEFGNNAFKLKPILIVMGVSFLVSILTIPLIKILKNQDAVIETGKKTVITNEQILQRLCEQDEDIDSLKAFVKLSAAEQIVSRKERAQILKDNKQLLLGQQKLDAKQDNVSREQRKVRREKKADESTKSIQTKPIKIKKKEPNWFERTFDKMKVMQNKAEPANVSQK